MELFNEFRNKSFNAFITLAERIANDNAVFSKTEFETEYYRLSGDENRITSIFYNNVINNEKYQIFTIPKDSKDKVQLSIEFDNKDDINIANIPITSEKKWLHSALHDKLSKLFLSDEEISYIDETISEFPLYYEHIDDSWRKGENISEESVINFRIILQAINEKKSLSYKYNGKDSEGSPVKIEYDERTCKIYMILYNGSRFIKSDISGLSDICIKEQLYEKIPDIKEGMLEKKARHPIVFTVTDNKNRKSIERALLAFSVYEHYVEPIDKNTAKFTIHYYTMDLDILIKDILAFGADIKVEAPQFVVKKIINILENV